MYILCRGVIDVDNGEYDKLIITGKPFAFMTDWVTHAQWLQYHIYRHMQTQIQEKTAVLSVKAQELFKDGLNDVNDVRERLPSNTPYVVRPSALRL